jgi:hypothetical protein
MVREDFSGPLLTCTDNDEPRYFQSGTICGANPGLRVQQGNVNDWLPWAWINGYLIRGREKKSEVCPGDESKVPNP